VLVLVVLDLTLVDVLCVSRRNRARPFGGWYDDAGRLHDDRSVIAEKTFARVKHVSRVALLHVVVGESGPGEGLCHIGRAAVGAVPVVMVSSAAAAALEVNAVAVVGTKTSRAEVALTGVGRVSAV